MNLVITGNKTIDRLPKKYTDAIADVSDEINNGDGWWIYLKEPFFNTVTECRTIHEQKLTECIEQLKDCVNNPTTKEEYFAKVIRGSNGGYFFK